MLCLCMPEVISSFKSLRAGSQMFVLLMLFLGVILHTMWLGNGVDMHFTLWHGVRVCHQYDVCKNSAFSVYVGGYGSLREGGLCVFRLSCSW